MEQIEYIRTEFDCELKRQTIGKNISNDKSQRQSISNVGLLDVKLIIDYERRDNGYANMDEYSSRKKLAIRKASR